MTRDAPPPEDRPLRAALAEIAVGLLLALAVIALARPGQLLEMGRSLWIPVGDPYVIGDVWGTLFLVERELRGETGCTTTLLQWPEGADLCRDFPNGLFTRLLAPLVGALGLPAGYNLGLLLLALTNGLACALAARVSGGDRLGGVLACAAGAATPMVFYEVFAGRPVTAWWAPAIAATALCAASLASWPRMALLVPGLGALALALQIYPYGVAMLLPWTVLLGVQRLLRGPGLPGRALRAALALAAAAGVARAVVQHTYGEALARFTPTLPYGEASSRWGLATATVMDGVVHWWGLAVVAFGALAMGLAGGRRGAAAGAGAALLLAVALGPAPFEDPRRAPPRAEAPYVQLMERVPLLRGSPRPDRYAIGAALLLAVALGAASAGPGRRPLRAAVGLATLGGLTLFNQQLTPTGWFPWPPLPALSTLEPEGAALDLPLVFPEDQAHLMAFLAWPAPRMNPLGHDPQELNAFARRAAARDRPLLLWALHGLEGDGRLPSPLPERAEGLRHVVLHRALMDDAAQSRAEVALRAAGARALLRDEDVVVFGL